jgi:hypothetical protein
MLGLARHESAWTLHYLWYDPGGEAGNAHRREIAQFIGDLGSDAGRFRASAYNQLFEQLQAAADSTHQSYIKYLGTRYFPRVVA